MAQLIGDTDTGKSDSQGDDGGDLPGQRVVDRDRVSHRARVCREKRCHLRPHVVSGGVLDRRENEVGKTWPSRALRVDIERKGCVLDPRL